MNKIPIGNTLQVRWRVKHNGQAESLEGLDLSLVMTTPSGQKQAMAFAVSDTNLVTVNYEGKDQQHLGNYRLDLFENRGENNQRRIDSTPAFVLVAHTAEAHRESDPSLEVYTVDLTGDIEIGYPSTAVLFTPQELTAEQKAQARANIGVEDEIFVAVYGVTTFAEVKAAHEAGTTIICKHGPFYEPLVAALLNTFTFCALLNKERLMSYLDANGWVDIDRETLATAAGLAGKADKSTTYTKSEVDTALAGKVNARGELVGGSKYEFFEEAEGVGVEIKENGILKQGFLVSKEGTFINDNKVATAADLAAKQDTISDLNDIRSGASAGATALQPGDIAEWAKQPTKPTYTASEVGALPSSTEIPSKTSDLTNDSGFIGDAPTDGKQYARKNGAWVQGGGNMQLLANVVVDDDETTSIVIDFDKSCSEIVAIFYEEDTTLSATGVYGYLKKNDGTYLSLGASANADKQEKAFWDFRRPLLRRIKTHYSTAEQYYCALSEFDNDIYGIKVTLFSGAFPQGYTIKIWGK